MDNSKITDQTAIVAPFPPRRRRTRRPRPIDLAHLAHQIANQLTVINFTCFKLRAGLKNTTHPLQADIGRLQNAVEEMQSLVEILSHLQARSKPGDTTESRSGNSGTAHRAKIYPIAKARKMGR